MTCSMRLTRKLMGLEHATMNCFIFYFYLLMCTVGFIVVHSSEACFCEQGLSGTLEE